MLAVELDAASGRTLRKLELFTTDNPAPIHAINSYASPTPVTDGQRLYCHFGALGTICVDVGSGEILWKERFVYDDITGPGNSPVLCGQHLILACDGADLQFVVAIDKQTGKEVWRKPRPAITAADNKLKRSFSTPLVIEHAGRTQVISPAAQWVISYDPLNGEEWWRVKTTADGHALVPRPVFHRGVVFVCTGYPKPELWAIRVDGSGDVSETHVQWTFSRQVPEISSPVIVGDQIYFVSVMGVATSLRVADGSLAWHQRLDGNYAASPLAADGKIFFTSQAGMTTVVRPGEKYEELSQNQLFGQTMASLAVSGDALLIRTDPVLYCIRKSSAVGFANPFSSP
jgi:outer membrane protein assembly factor BamB